MRLKIQNLRSIYPTFEALRFAAIHEMHVTRPGDVKLTNEVVLWTIWSHYSNANDVHAARVCAATNPSEVENAAPEIELQLMNALCKCYGHPYREWLQNGCG